MAEPLVALLAAALALAPVPAARFVTGPDEPASAPAPDEPAARASAPVPAPGPDGPAAAPAPEGPAPAPAPAGRCHGSRPCQRLVVLASVAGGLGLTAVIVGGVLAARPQRIDPDDPTRAIAYRPAGSAVLAIGLGVLATGVLMTLAAVRASRHAKRGGLTARRRPLALRLAG